MFAEFFSRKVNAFVCLRLKVVGSKRCCVLLRLICQRSAEVRNGVLDMSKPKLIIESHLGRTDCTGCRIYRKRHLILAIPVRIQRNDLAQKYPALPIKVAELSSEFAAELALSRIHFAIETDKNPDTEEVTVDLRDLQGS